MGVGNMGLPGLLLIAVFLGILALPFLVGKLANSRGRSFSLWTILSFLLTPLLGWIQLLVGSEKPKPSNGNFY